MTGARAARVALGLAALAVVAAAVIILATHDGASQLGAGQAAAATTTSTSAPLPPTRLTKLPHRTIINGMSPLVVRLSAPPAPTSPRPYLSPNVNGTWMTINNEEVFTPASTLLPCSDYSLTIPAGTTAVAHAPYGRQRTIALTVDCPPVRGLQVALARLNYLPDHLHPHFGRPQHRGPLTRVQAAALAWDPPSGHLVAEYPDAPPVEYGNGADGPTIGALEIFQADHGIDATGVPDTRTWESLLAAETHDRQSPHPYTWVTVTETLPETLEVHRDGRVVLSSPANTGVPGAATAQGVFPIFSRFVSTTMTGTNPDGSHYSDPGVPWVNYFNGGDAVHGFPRPGYGYPQSDGCVELPISTAAEVYPMLQIGDIVWVE